MNWLRIPRKLIRGPWNVQELLSENKGRVVKTEELMSKAHTHTYSER